MWQNKYTGTWKCVSNTTTAQIPDIIETQERQFRQKTKNQTTIQDGCKKKQTFCASKNYLRCLLNITSTTFHTAFTWGINITHGKSLN